MRSIYVYVRIELNWIKFSMASLNFHTLEVFSRSFYQNAVFLTQEFSAVFYYFVRHSRTHENILLSIWLKNSAPTVAFNSIRMRMIFIVHTCQPSSSPNTSTPSTDAHTRIPLKLFELNRPSIWHGPCDYNVDLNTAVTHRFIAWEMESWVKI